MCNIMIYFCNIKMKHLKHLKHKLATCAEQMSPFYLDESRSSTPSRCMELDSLGEHLDEVHEHPWASTCSAGDEGITEDGRGGASEWPGKVGARPLRLRDGRVLAWPAIER